MIQGKLEILQLKKAQLEEKIKREKAKHRAEQRKAETRRKIILGGLIQKSINDGTIKLCTQQRNQDGSIGWVFLELDNYLKTTLTEKDLALFKEIPPF